MHIQSDNIYINRLLSSNLNGYFNHDIFQTLKIIQVYIITLKLFIVLKYDIKSSIITQFKLNFKQNYQTSYY